MMHVELAQRAEALLAEALKVQSEYSGKAMPKEALDKYTALVDEAEQYAARARAAYKAAQVSDDLSAGTGRTTLQAVREAIDTRGGGFVGWETTRQSTPQNVSVGLSEEKLRILTSNEYKRAFLRYLSGGFSNLAAMDPTSTEFKVLQEGVDSQGGFVVPPDWSAEVIRKIAGLSAIRARARVRTTTRDRVQAPKINYSTGTDDLTGDIYPSGIRMTWAGEVPTSSTVHRVTEPVYGQFTVPINTAMASMPVTRDLVEDSAYNLIEDMSNMFAEAFALGEDDAFTTGSGAMRPQGLLRSACAYIAAGANADRASQIVCVKYTGGSLNLNSIQQMVLGASSLGAQYKRNAVFMMNSATAGSLGALQDSQNRPLELLKVTPTGVLSLDTKVGVYPVILNEFMPNAAASKASIIFGDLTAYHIYDRVTLTVEVLRELLAETNQVLLLGRKRVGGALAEPWRLRANWQDS